MAGDFDVPPPEASPVWARLYAARGDEVPAERPVFTGDVFTGVSVVRAGNIRTRSVMLLQHPCAIRADGHDLNASLLVAEVDRLSLLTVEQWQGNYDKMPLPGLAPEHETVSRRNSGAFFNRLYTVAPADLEAGTRIAILSELGVNILMQRWVHHSSRVVVPTNRFMDVTGGPYEEADLIQEWCETAGGDPGAASRAALDWLREPAFDGGPTRQDVLTDPQARSGIRKELRMHLRQLER